MPSPFIDIDFDADRIERKPLHSLMTRGGTKFDTVDQLMRPNWVTTRRCTSTACESCDGADLGCFVLKDQAWEANNDSSSATTSSELILDLHCNHTSQSLRIEVDSIDFTDVKMYKACTPNLPWNR